MASSRAATGVQQQDAVDQGSNITSNSSDTQFARLVDNDGLIRSRGTHEVRDGHEAGGAEGGSSAAATSTSSYTLCSLIIPVFLPELLAELTRVMVHNTATLSNPNHITLTLSLHTNQPTAASYVPIHCHQRWPGSRLYRLCHGNHSHRWWCGTASSLFSCG